MRLRSPATTWGLYGGGISNFSSQGQTFSVSTLRLDESQTWNAFAGDINVTSLVDLNNRALTVDGFQRTTISGAITNSVLGYGGVTKIGTGDLIFTGSTANTYSPRTQVIAGTLVLSKPDGVTAVAGELVIGDGNGTPSVRLQHSNQISDSASVTVNSGGVLNLNGFSESLGGLVLRDGRVLGGELGLPSETNSYGQSTIEASVNLGGAARTIRLSAVLGYATLTLPGVIKNGGIIYRGAGYSSSGTVLELSGENIFADGVTVDGGELRIGSDSALGSGQLTITSTGEVSLLRASNGARTLANPVRLLSNLTINGTDGLSFTGATSVQAGINITVADNTTSFTGPVTTTGGTSALTKSGAGTLVLSAVNTLPGLIVTAGTLSLTASNTIQGNVSVAGGGTLVLATANSVAGAVTVQNGTLAMGSSQPIGTATLNLLSGGSIRADAAVTLTNPVSLAFGVSGLRGSNDLTFNGDLSFPSGGSSVQLDVTNSGLTTINGAFVNLTGSNRLHKQGVGTLKLAGTVSNTSTGTIQVSAGTLLLAKTGGAIASAGSFYIGDGVGSNDSDVLRLLGNQQFSTTSDVGLGPFGLLDLNGFSTTVRALQMEGGHITTGSGVLTVGGDISGAWGNIEGKLDLGNAVRTVNAAGSSLQLSAVVSNGGVLKTGSGEVVLGAGNTFAGGLTVTQGIITLANDQAAGTGILSLSSSTLRSASSPRTIANPLALANTVSFEQSPDLRFTGAVTTSGAATIATLSGAQVTLSAPLSLGGALTVNTDSAGQVTLSGGVNESTSNVSITKQGTGALSMSGTSTFTGGVTLTSGTLAIGSSAALGSGNLTISGGTIRAQGGARSVSNAVNVAGGFTFGGSDDLTISGTATLTTSPTVTVTNTGVTTLAGNLGQDAQARSLSIPGPGMLVLSGTNTFSGGITLNGGTLGIGSDAALGSGTLLINTSGVSIQARDGARTVSNPVTLGADASFTGSNPLSFLGRATLSANRVIQVDAAASLTFAGVVGQTGTGRTLTKTGDGTLTLSGATDNEYTGDTTVNAGTLVLAKTGIARPILGKLLVGDGVEGASKDTVRLGVTNPAITAVQITVNSSGLLDLNGFNATVGTIALAGGTVTTGDGLLKLTAGMATTANSATAAISGKVGLNGVEQTLSVADGSAVIDLDISAIVQDGSLRKTGAGTLRLLGTNSFSGGLTIAAGVLSLGSNLAGGTGTLRMEGGTINADGGTRTLNNAITVAANSAIDSNQDIVLNGPLTGIGSATLTKRGTGALTLPPASLISTNLTLSAGTFSVSDVTIAAGTTFIQNGGATAGNITNQGSTSLVGGTFNGSLQNQGTTSISGPITITGGVTNAGALNVTVTGVATFQGTSLNNTGTISLVTGSVMTSSGLLTNNGTISGAGTINIAGGLTNNSTLRASNGILTLTGGGSITNQGSVELSGTGTLELGGATLSNGGSVSLGGGTLNGNGTLTNTGAGVVSGRGTVTTNFSNSGSLLVQGGAMNVTKGFTSTGLIQLLDISADLTGGAVVNSGSIQGLGKVGASLSNSGTIEAMGGTLVLGGAVTNTAAGLLTAPASAKLLVTAGLATNAGTINLGGGTFDNNGISLSNTGQISGFGTLRTGGLTNNGSVVLTGGLTTVNGNVTNSAGKTFSVRNNPALFTGTVVNNGVFEIIGTTATFAGGYTGAGPVPSAGGVEGLGSIVVAAAASVSANYIRQEDTSLVGSIVLRESASDPTVSVVQNLIISNGRFDLANNALVVDYTGATPAPSVRAMILSGFAGGSWTGNGLTSSSAAANPSQRALGYGEASTLLGLSGTNITTWLGQTVDATSVLVRYTMNGDADLSGSVNFFDLSALAARYGQAGNWQDGDFNYDGQINFLDLSALAAVYGTALPSEAVPGASTDFNADLAAASRRFPSLERWPCSPRWAYICWPSVGEVIHPRGNVSADGY